MLMLANWCPVLTCIMGAASELQVQRNSWAQLPVPDMVYQNIPRQQGCRTSVFAFDKYLEEALPCARPK